MRFTFEIEDRTKFHCVRNENMFHLHPTIKLCKYTSILEIKLGLKLDKSKDVSRFDILFKPFFMVNVN